MSRVQLHSHKSFKIYLNIFHERFLDHGVSANSPYRSLFEPRFARVRERISKLRRESEQQIPHHISFLVSSTFTASRFSPLLPFSRDPKLARHAFMRH
jgi:hypothetical protein